ncbi:sugar-binding protein [Paenibacillus rhizovicinus]|nr:sugar-binding protein [Paenibacillus rhizovicinus]
MPAITVATTKVVGAEPASTLSILDYGATPDDETDDTAAIVSTIADAKTQGATVYVPAGTFLFNDVIMLDGVDLTGDGETSILKSTNLQHQSIELGGDGSDLSNVQLTTVTASERLSTDDSARVFVTNTATNFSIKGVVIDGGSSAGIINFGNNGVISGNTVKNTLADGIHNTGGSSDLLIENNTCIDNGDDQIAIVSYEKTPSWSKRVTIQNNNVSGGHARGITVSGGEDITVENNQIANTGGAGVYIASEGNWHTYAVSNLVVRGNTITGDSSNSSVAERGGIRLQGTNKAPSIDNALIENNILNGSKDSAVLIVGSLPINATFNDNQIADPAEYGIRIVQTVVGTLAFSGNTVSGSGKAAFSNGAAGAAVTTDMENDPEAGGDGGTEAEFAAAKGTPIIDGVADEQWKSSSLLQMNTDANGTTGTAKIMWDDKNLYYLFDMKDSTPNAKGTNENNDSVEVWTDELDAKHGTMQEGDYQLRVDVNNALSSTIASMNLNKVKSAVKTTADGYVIEIAVPYTSLSPKAGDKIGFNASANDDANGDGKRDTYISWIDKSLPYWADTTVFQEITLIDPPHAAMGTPVIDGNADELWSGSSSLQMNTDANGTTGTAKVAWDSKNLYYLFDVKDSTPNASGTNENNDSVEVWTDELNAKHGTMQLGDYQARVDINNFVSSAVSSLDLTKVKSAVKTTADGYIVEFAVPFTALTPKPGDKIGFNATANDDANGDGKRDTYVSWVDKSLPYWADTTVFKEVTLVGSASGGVTGPTAVAATESETFDAKASFGNTQGTGGWYSMKKLNGTYSYLTQYVTDTIPKWVDPDSTTGLPYTRDGFFHPDYASDAVKKWVAPKAGNIDITGTVFKTDVHGDGIVASILKNKDILWSHTVTSEADAIPDGVTNIHVEAGDAIYFVVNNNGSAANDETKWMPVITMTNALKLQAEDKTAATGANAVASAGAEGGKVVSGFDQGDYLVYGNVNLSGGFKTIEARLASVTTGGQFEVRLDSLTGPVIGTFTVADTDGWNQYETQTWGLTSEAKGLHNLYIVGKSGIGIANIDWFRLTNNESRGATVPYTTYEAESGTLGGGAALNDTPDPMHKEVASGKSYVNLNGTGEYVQWSNARDANRFVLRYSIPKDSSGTLSLYVNDVKKQTIDLSSTYLYDTGDANATRRFDETDLAIDINAGDTVKLQKDDGDSLAWYAIDLIDLETAAAPLSMPANFISVKEAPYLAVGDGVADDTAAIQSAVDDAAAQGKGVWLPAGTYNQSVKIEVPSGVNIQGAGIWYSRLHATTSISDWGGTVGFTLNDNTTISDLRISSVDTQRGGHSGIVVLTNPGKGHNDVLQNLWAEHVGCLEGWTDWTDSVIQNVRIRDTYFDGIHWGDGGNSGNLARNNAMRGLGDDGVAQVNLLNFGAIANSNVAEFNSMIASYWGRGLSDIGGNSLTLRDNLVDSSYNAGMMVATEPVGDQAKHETSYPIEGLKFQRNTINKAGHTGHNHAGLHFWLSVNPMKDIRVELNTIQNGETEGIHIDNTAYGDSGGRTQFNFNTVQNNALQSYNNANRLVVPVLNGNTGFNGQQSASVILGGPAEAGAEQPVDVAVGLAGVASNVYAGDFTVQYDPSQLAYVSSESSVAGFAVVDESASEGKVRILGARTSGTITGTVDLLKLHFKAQSIEHTATSYVYVSNAVVSDASGNETKLSNGSAYAVQVIGTVQPADKTQLTAKLAESQEKFDASEVGTGYGNYPQNTYNALGTAIRDANRVNLDENALQAQVDETTVSLGAALQAFSASMITRTSVGDLGRLAARYGATASDSDWSKLQKYDFNHDGKLDIVDLAALARMILGNPQ